MQLNTAVDQFLVTGRAAGWSAATVKQYRWHLEQFATHSTAADLTDITKPLLRSYVANIRDDWQPATVRVAVITLRSFVRYCFEEELLPRDLSAALKVPKVPTKEQRAASVQEVQALLHAAQHLPTGLTGTQSNATTARNIALISLMFDSIPRAAEVCRINLCDLDLDQNLVTLHRKGGKVTTTAFSPETGRLLTSWLNYRPTVATDPHALFVAITGPNPGARLTTHGLRTIIRKLATKAGIPHLSPHAFRRGGTVAALENGAPTEVLRRHGGWEKIDMIETYSRTLNAQVEMRKYSPMNGVNNHDEPEQ